jgi:hypothetical protein
MRRWETLLIRFKFHITLLCNSFLVDPVGKECLAGILHIALQSVRGRVFDKVQCSLPILVERRLREEKFRIPGCRQAGKSAVLSLLLSLHKQRK